jgi:hypothetical protein
MNAFDPGPANQEAEGRGALPSGPVAQARNGVQSRSGRLGCIAQALAAQDRTMVAVVPASELPSPALAPLEGVVSVVVSEPASEGNQGNLPPLFSR